jgi:SOS-response transcriptional repressor LexA
MVSHPAYTSSLRVQNQSMEPVLQDGYIIVVDAYEKDRTKLRGDMIVAFSPAYGLFVSRLMWIKPAYVLAPDNTKYARIPVSQDCRTQFEFSHVLTP